MCTRRALVATPWFCLLIPRPPTSRCSTTFCRPPTRNAGLASCLPFPPRKFHARVQRLELALKPRQASLWASLKRFPVTQAILRLSCFEQGQKGQGCCCIHTSHCQLAFLSQGVLVLYVARTLLCLLMRYLANLSCHGQRAMVYWW